MKAALGCFSQKVIKKFKRNSREFKRNSREFKGIQRSMTIGFGEKDHETTLPLKKVIVYTPIFTTSQTGIYCILIEIRNEFFDLIG